MIIFLKVKVRKRMKKNEDEGDEDYSTKEEQFDQNIIISAKNI